jgi:hypothetical protein
MHKPPNIASFINSIVPDHISVAYPSLIEFVRVFFEYLDKENKSSYYQNTLYVQRDIREQDPQFFNYIKHELGVLYIKEYAADPKLFYDKMSEIWRSKGSEECLIFLLKAIAGTDENTKIIYPRESILRASDGVWEQEKFITVTKYVGSLPDIITDIILKYESSNKVLLISRFTVINQNTIRFYFKSNVTVNASVGQYVDILNINNEVVFEGRIRPSPSSIEIKNGGRNWQLGQIITIPGTLTDTLVQVTKVSSIGAIERAAILEYGYIHTENENITVSPYAIKPVATAFDYDYNPITKVHALDIFDYTDGTSETVSGTNSDISPDSYFLEDYDLENYAGRSVIEIIDIVITSLEGSTPNITLEDWILSRATLQYKFAAQSVLQGSWISNRGIISDNSIRLQDNYYYQQFSYVIESNVLRNVYQPVLNEIHPAGMKSFSTYLLENILDIDVEVETLIPFKIINLSDVFDTEDNIEKEVYIPRLESLTSSDSSYFEFIKSNEEVITSDENISGKSLNKYYLDTLTSDDLISNNLSKIFNDEVIAYQVDVNDSYDIEDYDSEDYSVFSEPESLQKELT